MTAASKSSNTGSDQGCLRLGPHDTWLVGTFDRVLCSYVLHYAAKSAESWTSIRDTITRHARKGTILVVSILDADKLGPVLPTDDGGRVTVGDSWGGTPRFSAQRIARPASASESSPCAAVAFWCSITISTRIGPLTEPVLSGAALVQDWQAAGWQLVRVAEGADACVAHEWWAGNELVASTRYPLSQESLRDVVQTLDATPVVPSTSLNAIGEHRLASTFDPARFYSILVLALT